MHPMNWCHYSRTYFKNGLDDSTNNKWAEHHYRIYYIIGGNKKLLGHLFQ